MTNPLFISQTPGTREDKVANLPTPKLWTQWYDEIWVNHVKKQYLPTKKVRDRPFCREDGLFFIKGIRELSDLFTDSRPEHIPAYLKHPKAQSSYLLYFFPLQMFKFFLIYQAADASIRRAFEARKRPDQPLRIIDYGSGPLTASLAFALYILEKFKDPSELPFPRIHILAVDQSRDILKQGELALQSLLELRPEWKNFFLVQKTTLDLRTIRSQPLEWRGADLHLFGNVLNELQLANLKILESKDFADASLGAFFLEPASRKNAQNLARIRELWLRPPNREDSDSEAGPITTFLPSNFGVLGPCPHLGICPLALGRDWCHFSTPFEIDSEWFTFFSKGLSKKREWLKFSYLWMFPNKHVELPESKQKLVVSDTFFDDHIQSNVVLLCTPERPTKYPLPPGRKLYRGDWVKIIR